MVLGDGSILEDRATTRQTSIRRTVFEPRSRTQVYRRPSGDLVRRSSFCDVLQEDGARTPTLQKSAATVVARPRDRVGGRRYVAGLTSVAVDAAESALHVVRRGLANRATRQTKRNDASSRSHAVLQISAESRAPGDAALRRAKLYLVDLAGSERAAALEDSKGFGEHVAINQSLSALGNVIAALSEGPKRRPHVPSRAPRGGTDPGRADGPRRTPRPQTRIFRGLLAPQPRLRTWIYPRRRVAADAAAATRVFGGRRTAPRSLEGARRRCAGTATAC